MSETTMQTIDLPVLGMTCAACVRRVERAVSSLPGIAKADVNLPLSRARLELDPSVASVDGAAAAIREAGYEVPADVVDAIARGASHEAGGAGAARLAAIAKAEAAEVRTLRRDAALAIGLTIPLLVIAMAHGLVEGVAGVVVQFVLGTLVVLVPGRHYFRRGFIAVRHGAPDMNTLIALGAGAAWLSSTIVAARWLAGADHHAQTPHHMPAVYFEAGAAIVAFVMIGKLLESRARARLSEAVRGLLSLAPTKAHRIVDDKSRPEMTAGSESASDPRSLGGTRPADKTEEVDAASLAPGDVVRVRPGERIAADGTVVDGTSSTDESMLTGESMPVDKAEGSPVYAGTLNHQGALTVRVARSGGDTSLARIARAVEDAQGAKAPIARLADRVSAVFVPVVLAIAAITFVAWLAAGATPGAAVERMVAVLVIACPCALGLATPAAVAVGTARGAELGVLFTGGAALERASGIEAVLLDKTGTLTTGRPTLVAATSDDVLRIAAAIEAHSEHPFARAIVDGAKARGMSIDAASGVTADPGRGLAGTTGGKSVRIGTREYLALAGVTAPDVDAPGRTVSFVAIDGAFAGTLEISDPPAEGARAAVDALRALGVETAIVTGDRAEAAGPIAAAVGIDRVHAGISPLRKAAVVEQERAGGRTVAMVGDGINDAPALAAADLGVALGTGTDIAAAAADVTLLRGGIGALPTAFSLARATLHTIRRNLVAAFAYNIICIPIAAGALYPFTGWQLSPVIASAAMSLSSVSVLLSSLRLRRYKLTW